MMRKLLAAILCSGIVSLSFGQEMVKVEGGTFVMGSNDLIDNEYSTDSSGPPHSVTLSSFSIGKYEITYEKWIEVSTWGLLHGYSDLAEAQNGYEPVGSNNPVTKMIWYDVVKWCNARSEKEGLTPVYYTSNTLTTIYRSGSLKLTPDCIKWTANGYRLPTEAEWEFAAKGGMKSKNYTYSGSNTVEDVAWVRTNSGSATHSVGLKTPNELGLFDMSGNVSEWVSDMSGAYSDTAQTDPKGPDSNGSYRIGRGGSFNNICTIRARITFRANILTSDLGFRCVGVQNSQLSISTPSKGETILADASYFITWDATGVDSIKIEYSVDDGKTFNTITDNVPAAAGSFEWHVPDTLSSKCRLVITNLDNPAETAAIDNFRIKGYVLTRFKANGDFEAYDPALHGWQFRDTAGNMWPDTWFNRFVYKGTDPNTGQLYPAFFTKSFINARGPDFPDWPLYTQTFGIDRCYLSKSPPAYSPSALSYWKDIKKDVYRGRCFGFVTSSLLEFDFPEGFRASFPQLGSYTNLMELPLNDYRRDVINQLYLYQYGYAALLYDQMINTRTPRETLQDTKDYFLSPIRNHACLKLCSNYSLEKKPEGHIVLPYALKRIPKTSRFELLVYDSNCPSGNCDGNVKSVILIDSLLNSWSYPLLKWTDSNKGLFFDSPINTYLLMPVIPIVPRTKSATIGEKSSLQVMYTNSASINISNSSGHAIGFADSTGINTMPDGFPVIPKTGHPEAPIGYVIPSGSYAITMSAFRDSVTSTGVFGNSSVFSYWRGDAVSSQTDHLTYDGGLRFGNPDAQTKTVNFEAITRLTDCESGFQIMNFEVVQNDSVRIEMPDMNRVAFVNLGPAKTYDLDIVKACNGMSGQFNHEHIAIPAHSTHYIVPDLQDLSNNPVKIYVDQGNTGIISDSLFVWNQSTGIENPLNTGTTDKFSLGQNYPNPFSTSTTIMYKVTEPGFVLLRVFDVMGTEVATLVNEQKPVGEYSIDWNATGLVSGIYFCKLQNGNNSEVKKMLILK